MIPQDPRWYCFRAEQKKEHIVAESIEKEIGLEAFCPRITEWRKTRRGKTKFTSAMFTCYIFVKLDIHRHLQDLLRFRGVVCAVRYGAVIPPISDAFVSELRSELQNDCLVLEERKIEAGGFAKIEDGPFKGMVCRVLEARDGIHRASVLLDLICQNVELRISREALVGV